jgi:hypothetical protein
MTINSNKITLLNNVKIPTKFEGLTIDGALKYIKNSETMHEKIENLRTIVNDDEKYKALKEQLPAFSFSGTFKNSVLNDSFIEHSGVFTVDIDHLEDVNADKALVCSIPYVLACFISPSGKGLKAILRIDTLKDDADLKTKFASITALFAGYGINIDQSGKDIRRVCFASYDPDIYINYDAEIFYPEIIQVAPKKTNVLPFTPAVSDVNTADTCIKRITDIMQSAVPGDRHITRLKAAKLAGGFVAGGLLDERQARDILEQLSHYISDNGTTSSSEIKTIDDGFKEGLLSPITHIFTQRVHEQYVEQHNEWETPFYKIILHEILAPFPGVMKALVEETLRVANKPQPELSILSALIGMAASIGGNYKTPGGQRFNLYGIGISGTGTGKDKAMLPAIMLSKVASAELGGQPGSGAALEDMLEERGTKILLNMDEVAHFIASMNDIKQTHMASLAGYLLKLFSASRGVYHTRRLANSSNNAQKECINPCVSLMGFACPEKLGDAFGHSSNIEDGLMGRVLFVSGRDSVKPRRDQGEFAIPGFVIDTCKKISFNQDITLEIDYQADSELDRVLMDFDNESGSSSNPFAKALKMRSYEKCERVAGVLAVFDNPVQPVIRLQHIEWAEMFIKYCDKEILEFTSKHLHGGQVQSDAAKITSLIDRFGSGVLKATNKIHSGMIKDKYFPRSLLLKNSKLCKRDFDFAIDHLTDLELVKPVNWEGKNSVFRAILVNKS